MRKKGLEYLKDTFAIEAECLSKSVSFIDERQFCKAVDLLVKAERIATSGCGHSGIACQHFAHLMCCIERPARFISPSEAIHGGTGYLQENDVMLFVSRGGRSEELLPILDICKKKNVKIIVITEDLESILAKEADAVLKQFVTRETDKYNCQGTTSTTIACVIFHALQAAIMEATDFQNQEFMVIHPGGAVGERLREI